MFGLVEKYCLNNNQMNKKSILKEFSDWMKWESK